MSRLVPFVSIVAVSLLLCASLALADEEQTREDSAAARLFREGWWLETGAGALDRAATQYEKAVTAEGSEAVRARALYRLAIVRHRMGMTDQAIRDLDRLTKSFAEQSKLLVQAKARLEEWTAEDLRGAFAEWYRRYQYSPEFQAKVVDLVLQLGTNDNNRRKSAFQELLTIGEPAVQALRQHVTSNNGELREQTTTLLFQLGIVPPAYGLLNAHRWRRLHASWGRVLDLKGDEKAAVLKALEGEAGMQARELRLALTEPERVVDLLEESSQENGYVNTTLLFKIIERGLSEERLAQLRRYVVNSESSAHMRTAVASSLTLEKGQIAADDVLAWSQDADARMRKLAWPRFRKLDSPKAWRVAARSLDTLETNQSERTSIVAAMLQSMAGLDADTDTSAAYEALRKQMTAVDANYLFTTNFRRYLKENPAAKQVIARLVETTRTQNRTSMLMWEWWYSSKQDDAATEQLAKWAVSSPDAATRQAAAQHVARSARHNAATVMAMMKDESARKELARAVFQGLRNNQSLPSLSWADEDLRLLVLSSLPADSRPGQQPRTYNHRIGTQPATFMVQTKLDYNTTWILNQLLVDGGLFDRMLAVAAKDPVAFTNEVWNTLPPNWRENVENQQRVVRTLQEAWGAWTDEQRLNGLSVFVHKNLVGPETADERDRFLRRQLASTSGKLRSMILSSFSKVTLEDIRAAYDLSDPKAVDEAVTWIDSLEPSEAVYDAFKLVVRPSADDWSFPHLYDYIGKQMLKKSVLSDATQHDFISRIFTIENDTLNRNAVLLLQSRNTVKDMDLWLKALTHKNPKNRSAAATMLGSIFNDDAIVGLTNAIDDPDPTVRDAALGSLSRIRKIQEQKAFWKDRAKKGDGK